jgi:hypothetical protein
MVSHRNRSNNKNGAEKRFSHIYSPKKETRPMTATAKRNVKLKKGFQQVCIWPATDLGDNTPKDFEKFIKTQFGARAQFLEVIETFPDLNNGRHVEGTGGRSDLFFAIHSEDIHKFAIARLQYGISWVEDTLAPCNYRSPIYPERVFDYKCWDAGSGPMEDDNDE